MPRLNIYENISINHSFNQQTVSWEILKIHGVYIPGSISFNNIAIYLVRSGTIAKTLSVSFGLYSLNGSTLSLANSASQSNSGGASSIWLTLGTSTTQDISPGNWYLGIVGATTGANSFLMVGNVSNAPMSGGGYAGRFVRGIYSVSTNGLPSSIATSDMNIEGTYGIGSNLIHSYILISA